MSCVSLTYGTLPTREAFDAHYARIVGAVDDDGEGATYALDLKGADARAAEGDECGSIAFEGEACCAPNYDEAL